MSVKAALKGGLHFHSRQNTHLSSEFGWYRKLTLLSRNLQQMSAVCLSGKLPSHPFTHLPPHLNLSSKSRITPIPVQDIYIYTKALNTPIHSLTGALPFILTLKAFPHMASFLILMPKTHPFLLPPITKKQNSPSLVSCFIPMPETHWIINIIYASIKTSL